jgi:hypothetical protein
MASATSLTGRTSALSALRVDVEHQQPTADPHERQRGRIGRSEPEAVPRPQDVRGDRARFLGSVHGASRFFTSEQRAAEYWDVVRSQYGSRWAEFLADTLLGGVASRGPSLGSASFERLVTFCVLLGQRGLAQELVEEMVTRALELVSPVVLPVPGWVQLPQETP